MTFNEGCYPQKCFSAHVCGYLKQKMAILVINFIIFFLWFAKKIFFTNFVKIIKKFLNALADSSQMWPFRKKVYNYNWKPKTSAKKWRMWHRIRLRIRWVVTPGVSDDTGLCTEFCRSRKVKISQQLLSILCWTRSLRKPPIFAFFFLKSKFFFVLSIWLSNLITVCTVENGLPP